MSVKTPKDDSKTAYNWQAVLDHAYLSMYQDNLGYFDAPLPKPPYDYVLYFEDTLVFILVEHASFEADSPQIAKSVLNHLHQQAGMQLFKRHQQARKKMPNLQVYPSQRVFYVGLMAVEIKHENNTYLVDYPLGSHFFQEECVLDFDNEVQILQIFSVQGLQQVVHLLATPSDFLAFLQYHRQTLLAQTSFYGEFGLAQTFLNSPQFFQRAWQIEQKLVEMGILDRVNARLEKAVSGDKESIELLVKEMKNVSELWLKLVRGLLRRTQQANKPISWPLIRKLIDESLYTRLKFMQEVFAYREQSRDDCLQGYVCYQHSYQYFGRHYMMVIYGLLKDAMFSKSMIEAHHQSMLLDVNAQLQDPVMKDLFLLGLDMSNQDGQGNVEVQLEAFYQAGFLISESEKRLQEEILALKSENEKLRQGQ